MPKSIVQRWGRVAVSASLFAACALAVPRAARAICAAPVTCVCQEWPNAHVVHGSVRESVGTTSQIEVHEVLAGEGVDLLSPGDVIQGELEDPATCGVSLATFVPGDEVLALWQGTMPDPLECPEFADCTTSRCAAWAGDPSMRLACNSECVDAVREMCPNRVPRLVLLPWAKNLDLGQGRTLAADAASVLADRNRCNDALAGPAPPCNDQVLVEVRDRTCSAGAPGLPASDQPMSLVGLAGVALAFWSLRARSRRS